MEQTSENNVTVGMHQTRVHTVKTDNASAAELSAYILTILSRTMRCVVQKIFLCVKDTLMQDCIWQSLLGDVNTVTSSFTQNQKASEMLVKLPKEEGETNDRTKA